jgi:hypothetical protein
MDIYDCVSIHFRIYRVAYTIPPVVGYINQKWYHNTGTLKLFQNHVEHGSTLERYLLEALDDVS